MDDFDKWLTDDAAEDSAYNQDLASGGGGAKYRWQDKNDNWHEVIVTLDLPNIEQYKLRCTKLDFEQTKNQDAQRSSFADSLIGIIGFEVSTLGYSSGGCFLVGGLYFLSWILTKTPLTAAAGIVLKVAAFVAKGSLMGTVLVSLFSLFVNELGQAKWAARLGDVVNDISFEHTDPVTGLPFTQISSGYDNDKDLMIVSIEEISFTGDKQEVTCHTQQTHPGMYVSPDQDEEQDSGKIGIRDITTKSQSTSKFSGGSMTIVELESEGTEGGEESWYSQVMEVLRIMNITVTMLPWQEHVVIEKTEEAELPEVLNDRIEKAVDANYSPEIISVE
jgi:hypothetical protein